MITKTIVLLALITFATCDFHFGRCKDVNHNIDALDVNNYLGKWYEVARSKAIPFEKHECVQAEYSFAQNNTYINVNNSQFDGENRLFAIGKARTTKDPFRLSVSFSDSWWGKFFEGDYQVIDTDYENFSLIFSCSNFGLARIEFAWILSRTPILNQDKLDELLHYLQRELKISRDSLHFTDQSKSYCGY